MIRVFGRAHQALEAHTAWAAARPLAELRGALAYRRFCTPSLSRHRSRDHDQLTERARFHLRQAAALRVATTVGAIQAYVFEPEQGRAAASVLMVHGWTGEASFMSAFAEHFRRRGFRVVLFDLPAHGQSAGRRTSLIACAHAVREVAEALGPMTYAVTHSLGGLAALVAAGGRPPMPRAYPFEALVLVSMPNRFAEVTSRFGAELGLAPSAQRAYERRLERLAQRTIGQFTGANLLTEVGRPALLLHSTDDDEVAFDCAQQIASHCTSATLKGFDGLGHRKILYAPPVVRAAAAYLLDLGQAKQAGA